MLRFRPERRPRQAAPPANRQNAAACLAAGARQVEVVIDGIRFKVCGLTSLVDAEFADRAGADFLGFILHPKSPRYLPLLNYTAMQPRLPTGRKQVAVMVEPELERLQETDRAGFDRFQLHFRSSLPLEQIQAWSASVGPERLWLAPRRAPGEPFNEAWLPLARTFLMDTFQVDGFGGSGRVGDWTGFRALQAAYPRHTWILAGGLAPENIAAALAESGARLIDVNSGVEQAPGIKDPAKVRQFILAIHRARTPSVPLQTG